MHAPATHMTLKEPCTALSQHTLRDTTHAHSIERHTQTETIMMLYILENNVLPALVKHLHLPIDHHTGEAVADTALGQCERVTMIKVQGEANLREEETRERREGRQGKGENEGQKRKGK